MSTLKLMILRLLRLRLESPHQRRLPMRIFLQEVCIASDCVDCELGRSDLWRGFQETLDLEVYRVKLPEKCRTRKLETGAFTRPR